MSSVHALVAATCPACGFHSATPFFENGAQPLVTQSWPATTEEAQAAPRYTCDYARCLDCGHIYNPTFDYRHVPYSEKPNLMFNKGKNWSGIIRQLQEYLFTLLPENPTFVEIGHGDGSFLSGLLECGNAHCIGFDPHGALCNEEHLRLCADFFIPATHLPSLQPDMILARHVLEHLDSPLSLLQDIAVAATLNNRPQLAYFEVPCADRVLTTGRTTDFYYEHRSQFTTRSFESMLLKAGATILKLGHIYQQEVLYAFVSFDVSPAMQDVLAASTQYLGSTRSSKDRIDAQIAELAASGRPTAIWGGVGKAAAFINRYQCTPDRFPTVVDSDQSKVGTHVPGTGQTIRFRDWLLEQPVEVILIPTQWRANDIVQEIKAHGIAFEQVLIEHDGRLIDFFKEPHPYQPEPHDSAVFTR